MSDHWDLSALDEFGPDDRSGSDAGDLPQFTVTGAYGRVTVTTQFTGQVEWIALSPRVTQLSESELEREVLAVAAVASLKARAAQSQFVTGLMLTQGQDRDTVRNLVEHHMGLPTPEQALIAEAALTSTVVHDED